MLHKSFNIGSVVSLVCQQKKKHKIHFELKLFNIAMTLKYVQGHWKWYVQVKLNKQYHHAKFDIYNIMVSE